LLAPAETVLPDPLRGSRTEASGRVLDYWPPLLHSQSDLETDLVFARFRYDAELLGKDEIDDRSLVGLQGVVKISHAIVHGISVLNLDGFAPLSRWKELSPTAADDAPGSEVA